MVSARAKRKEREPGSATSVASQVTWRGSVAHRWHRMEERAPSTVVELSRHRMGERVPSTVVEFCLGRASKAGATTAGAEGTWDGSAPARSRTKGGPRDKEKVNKEKERGTQRGRMR